MNKLQAIINGMNAEFQKGRANSQMTLGGLISALNNMPKDMLIEGLDSPHSYRGYYCDLAFDTKNDRSTVEEMTKLCSSVMGKVFEGYKGGDYLMGETTPLWIANYGCCGVKIISIDSDGNFEISDDE